MKKSLGPQNYLYPMPMVLAGAMVHGKPNYLAVAHVGIVDFGVISLSLGRSHYTNAGIREHQAFSVNIPSRDQAAQVDYCGLVSGRDHDKASLFDNFFGEVTGAPMIREFPLNMECKLEGVIERSKHDVFLGEIAATFCDEAYLTDGVPDMAKIKPLLFVGPDKGYYELGPWAARAWSVGKGLKK